MVVKWIGDWRQGELESLPGNRDNTAVAQGRCLVLAELHKLFQDAPGITAKSSDSRTQTRTP
jgi:hypothetical protein